jgi:hypothetical protein
MPQNMNYIFVQAVGTAADPSVKVMFKQSAIRGVRCYPNANDRVIIGGTSLFFFFCSVTTD